MPAEQSVKIAVRGLTRAIGVLLFGMLCALPAPASADVDALEQCVAELTRQLEEARRALAVAKDEPIGTGALDAGADDAAVVSQKMIAPGVAAETDEALDESAPESTVLPIGPVTVGGAMRVNDVPGSYKVQDAVAGPNRGGNGGNIELDTFRTNLALDYETFIGRFANRWYAAGIGKTYNVLHTGWLGYRFADDSGVQGGVNRGPFAPGAYGVLQSWFFDQHSDVGLSDDMDLGIKYSTAIDQWKLDMAGYPSSAGRSFGRSLNSAPYSYDAVRWEESVDADGNVSYGGKHNGFDECDQLNLHAI